MAATQHCGLMRVVLRLKPCTKNLYFQQKAGVNCFVWRTKDVYFQSSDLHKNVQKHNLFIFFLMKNLVISKKKIALPIVNKDY